MPANAAQSTAARPLRVSIACHRSNARAILAQPRTAGKEARRKAIYEQLHPETKLGANQHQGRVRQIGEPTANRFTKDAEAKTGMSERSVQRGLER